LEAFVVKKIEFMKTPAILFLALLLFPLTASAQRQCVLINRSTFGTDTIFSLGIAAPQMDSVRATFLRTYGAPVVDSYGTMTWKGVSLPNLGEQLEIHYTDMLCSTNNKNTSCKYFRSEADKSKRMGRLKENQHRRIVIEIKDASGRAVLRSRSVALDAANLFGGSCK